MQTLHAEIPLKKLLDVREGLENAGLDAEVSLTDGTDNRCSIRVFGGKANARSAVSAVLENHNLRLEGENDE